MTKAKAITLGIFTLWPIVYMLIFMVMMCIIIATSFANGPKNEPPLFLMIIFPVHFLTGIEIFILIAIYIVYLFKTETVPQDKKALWAVVLFLGNMFAMPIFWYLYIWKNIKSEQAPPGNQAPPSS